MSAPAPLTTRQLGPVVEQLARQLKAAKPQTHEVVNDGITGRAHRQWAADVRAVRDALIRIDPGVMEHRFMDACTLEGHLR